MKYQQKKGDKKTKYQQKDIPQSKFNFYFDQKIVTYRTQIDQIPQKLKVKPNEKQYQKKCKSLQDKIQEMKAQRKTKKTQYKSKIKNDFSDIQELKYKISLGKKCLLVLNYDLNQYNYSISQIVDKIQQNQFILNQLKKNVKKNQKIQYDQMTCDQLQKQIDKLSVKVTTASLNKKQQTQINALIGKLNRLKMSASKSPRQIDIQQKQNNQKRRQANENIRKLKKDQEYKQKQVIKVIQKIQSIEQDIKQFSQLLKEIVLKEKDPEVQMLHQQCQELKKKIQNLKEQLSIIQKDYQNQKYQYQYEQQKIKWINWATEVQNRKIQQWQQEKAAKRRQKIFKEKKNGQDDNDQKSGQNKQIQRKIINRYQKQIDASSFLIDYCKRLYPQKTNNTQNKNQNHPQKNLQDKLQKGQWAKMKGVQIVQSKKEKNLQETQKKNHKKKQKKQEVIQEDPNKITHDYFIQNVFDSIKVVPPTLVEEVEKTVVELNQKLEYYISHPQGSITKPEKVDKEKKKYTAEKYAKAKNQNKKIINTEDFPAL